MDTEGERSHSRILPRSLNEKRFRYLLIALVVMFFGIPLLGDVVVARTSLIGRVIYILAFLSILWGTAAIVSRKKVAYIVVVAMSVSALILNALYLRWEIVGLLIWNHIILVGLLLFIVVSLTRYLFACSIVTKYTLHASLCAFLLIALLWALIYGVVDMLDPGVFRIPEEISPEGRMANFGDVGSFHALYFSIVTITTLGYGDISPISVQARMLCSAEAFVGQMFVAITVARLVGIYTSRSLSKSNSFSE